jgi:hypothetical protein
MVTLGFLKSTFNAINVTSSKTCNKAVRKADKILKEYVCVNEVTSTRPSF